MKIKSKEHNIQHYPASIKRAGPLSLQSSSLCEAFHQFVKRAFGSSRCTKNLLKTILRRIDGKLIARSKERVESWKVSTLKKEDGLDQEALSFYRQYNERSWLKSVTSEAGKICINSVLGCPKQDGAPEGRFFNVLALVHMGAEQIRILGQPLHVVPLPDFGLIELIAQNSTEVFEYNQLEMIMINAYVVEGKRVISVLNFDLNQL